MGSNRPDASQDGVEQTVTEQEARRNLELMWLDVHFALDHKAMSTPLGHSPELLDCTQVQHFLFFSALPLGSPLAALRGAHGEVLPSQGSIDAEGRARSVPCGNN
jgi:hypothetical protein